MAFVNWKGEIVSNRIIKIKIKKKADSIEWRSFYFLWPRNLEFPLYVWHVIEDMWKTLYVFIRKRTTWESKECIIKRSIITLDKKNEY